MTNHLDHAINEKERLKRAIKSAVNHNLCINCGIIYMERPCPDCAHCRKCGHYLNCNEGRT